MIIEKHKADLIKLCRRYHVSVLEAFGSVATAEFDEQKSDVDFLVTFDKSVSKNRFDNFFTLLEELKKLFGRDVDLVEPGGLKNPYFIKRVNQTRRHIYDASRP